jgi:hypothetical protein
MAQSVNFTFVFLPVLQSVTGKTSPIAARGKPIQIPDLSVQVSTIRINPFRASGVTWRV